MKHYDNYCVKCREFGHAIEEHVQEEQQVMSNGYPETISREDI